MEFAGRALGAEPTDLPPGAVERLQVLWDLTGSGARHGVYVVAFLDAPNLRAGHRPRWRTIDAARTDLTKQAADVLQVAAGSVAVLPVVLDARLGGAQRPTAKPSPGKRRRSRKGTKRRGEDDRAPHRDGKPRARSAADENHHAARRGPLGRQRLSAVARRLRPIDTRRARRVGALVGACAVRMRDGAARTRRDGDRAALRSHRAQRRTALRRRASTRRFAPLWTR